MEYGAHVLVAEEDNASQERVEVEAGEVAGVMMTMASTFPSPNGFAKTSQMAKIERLCYILTAYRQ